MVNIETTGLAVQDGTYEDVDRKTGKRATIEQLLKFATNEPKLDYLFWVSEAPYFSQQLIPFMQSANSE